MLDKKWIVISLVTSLVSFAFVGIYSFDSEIIKILFIMMFGLSLLIASMSGIIALELEVLRKEIKNEYTNRN